MKGHCRLYDTYGELRESHIHPKFAIDYTKKTGGRFLRRLVEPNKRIQDGEKDYLLSERAEQEFGKREKWFAENILIEFMERNRASFNYDDRLYYFCISYLWRVLLKQLEHKAVKEQLYYNDLFRVAEEWKCYLKDGIVPENYNRVYLFFTDRVAYNPTGLKDVDFYMTRAIDSTIVSNPDCTFVSVYCKFLRFTFWGIIKGGNENEIDDLRVFPNKGHLKFPQHFGDITMTSFFGNRIRGIESLPKASENQLKKVAQEILKDPDAFFSSDAGRAWHNDKVKL